MTIPRNPVVCLLLCCCLSALGEVARSTERAAVAFPIAAGSGLQEHPYVVSDDDGGAIVLWHQYPGTDVLAQRILRSGGADPAWPSRGLYVTRSPHIEGVLSAVGDGRGGAIFAWFAGSAPDLYVQHVLASGSLDSEWPYPALLLPAVRPPSQRPDCELLEDGSGGALVVWTDGRDGRRQLRAHHVLAAGRLDPAWPAQGAVVSGNAGNQIRPSVALDGAGGIFVGWEDDRGISPADWSNWDVFVQHILGTGTRDPRWPEEGIALSARPGSQFKIKLASDGRDGVVAAWHDRSSSSPSVVVQHVLASGTTNPTWPQGGRRLGVGVNQPVLGGAVGDGKGGVVLCWIEQRVGVVVSRVDKSGRVPPEWPPDGLALDAPSSSDPVIATDGAGGALVAWVDWRSKIPGDNDVFAQHVLSSGRRDSRWPVSGLNLSSDLHPQFWPRMASDRRGAVIVWHDKRNDFCDIFGFALPQSWAPVPGNAADATSVGSQGNSLADSDPLAGSTALGEVTPASANWALSGPSKLIVLSRPMPNPTKGPVVFRVRLAHEASATFTIFGPGGRLVRDLAPGVLPAGEHAICWDGLDSSGRPVMSGLYIVRLESEGQAVVQKVVVTR